MGNSSTSGFDLGERVECADNKHWAINLGSRKDGEKEPVTIMSFNKKQFADKLAPAQRCIQKSKTLKHPFIVAYVESAEYDDSLVLVTEQCKPLDAWLVEHAARAATDAAFSQELVWGFRCVLEALHFLHSNGLVHGYLGLHAVFVTKGGDMKVGALDLAANMTAEDDFAFLRTYAHLLGRPYLAPERADLARGNALKGGGKAAAGSEADIFALAHCIQAAFNKANLEVPPALAKYFSRMMSPDAVKRPTASQLLKVPVFNSDDIKLLVSLGELAGLKPANESLGTLKELSTKVDAIPTTICVHKILPSVARALQMACTDFANRDARELCRTSIQLSLDLLAQLAVRAKVDEDSFASKCLPAVLQLWSMTDRAVRTALLGSLKQLITLTPASAVNKSIFDQMLAGFADSNAK
jgi:SCY1-like protein 1